MLTRIRSLVGKEFIHLIRNWGFPAFMVLGGALELLLVGWATSRPITNLPFMVLDHDRTPASRALVTRLVNTDTFAPPEYVTEAALLEDALRRDAINAALVIPPDFAARARSRPATRSGRLGSAASDRPTLQVLLNGAQSTAATAVMRTLDGVAAEMNVEIVAARFGPDELLAASAPSVRVWFNEALSEALYTTPAELALMLEFTVLILVAMAFSRERELGTLEQLLVMPFRSLEIIVGKSIPAMLVSFVDFVLMLGLVYLAFDVPVRGSLPLLLLLAAGYIVVELGKGLVISVMSRTQHQAFLLVFVVGFFDFMFTGYAAPVESMPRALQFIANFIPAHHWLVILRGLLLKGVGLDVLWPNVLALAGLGIVIVSFSLRYVRRALN
ncbi:MAG: ABC transporter permease [Anaerolineales bacterium]